MYQYWLVTVKCTKMYFLLWMHWLVYLDTLCIFILEIMVLCQAYMCSITSWEKE